MENLDIDKARRLAQCPSGKDCKHTDCKQIRSFISGWEAAGNSVEVKAILTALEDSDSLLQFLRRGSESHETINAQSADNVKAVKDFRRRFGGTK